MILLITEVKAMVKPRFKHFIILLCLLLILSIAQIAWSYNLYSKSIIKDVNLYKYLKEQYVIKGSIEPKDVEGIYRLYMDYKGGIRSLDGIQYFKGLKHLTIMQGNNIEDHTLLKELPSLESLTIWECDLDKLERIGHMKSIKKLDILYPKDGRLDSLENFPNLQTLRIHGMKFENLHGLKGPKNLTSITIANGEVVSFDGIESFPNLEQLDFYELTITDVSKVFELENLKLINLQGGYIENGKEFLKGIEENNIYTNERSVLEKILNLD